MANIIRAQKALVMEITSKEREVRPNSIADIKVDASFRKIARNAICFHVWKIEEDRLEAEPKTNYGTFYDDCAYIIYAASPIGCFVNQHTITREARIGTYLERFIHFWLGDKVSEQKRSNVAHKIQELDSYFGNVATEFRETQDNESARFLSYFKKGITVLSGELVSATNLNRLYQIRGRKWLRCIEMPNTSWEHFGSDYIMLLQTIADGHVYMWIGRSSSNIERRDAIEMIGRFQNDARHITIIDDGYEQSMPENRKEVWNSFLPLTKRVVSQTSLVVDKAAQSTHKMKIYKCGYQGTRLHLDQLDVAIPTKDDLSDSNAVYVLDGNFEQGVWLWAGAQASNNDKISAMGNGRAFVKKKKYPYATPVVRVVEGCEPIEFTRLFPNWPSDWNDATVALVKPISTLHGKFDARTLCQRPKMAAETQLIDDGSGERNIFHICSDQVIELPSEGPVMFTTNDCYVVEYFVVCASLNSVDNENVGLHSIIYQWNGSEAKADLIQRTERFARKSFEEAGVKTMFVQMVEGDETPHFLQIFGGKLIILLNDKYLQINNNNLDKTSTTSLSNQDTFVLRIYGDATYNAKAVEVYPLNAMNSKECYVMKTVSEVWVWCGNGSTGDSREMAKGIGGLLGESHLVLEGKEPKDFWRTISSQLNKRVVLPNSNNTNSPSTTNGNGYHRTGSTTPPSLNCSLFSVPANSTGYLPNIAPTKARPLAQLFIVWMRKDVFMKREIIGYEQADMSPECLYILDAGLITYVWLGSHAPTPEKDDFMKLAQCYMETVPIARRPSTAIAIIRQNWEPNVFKGFFDNWTTNLWTDYQTYEQKRQVFVSSMENTPYTNGKSIVNGANGCSPLPTALLRHQIDFDRHNKYPIDKLQLEADALPSEVNPLKRELHLTHDDFMALFKMPFKEFQDLPLWRQHELKKKHKLF